MRGTAATANTTARANGNDDPAPRRTSHATNGAEPQMPAVTTTRDANSGRSLSVIARLVSNLCARGWSAHRLAVRRDASSAPARVVIERSATFCERYSTGPCHIAQTPSSGGAAERRPLQTPMSPIAHSTARTTTPVIAPLRPSRAGGWLQEDEPTPPSR